MHLTPDQITNKNQMDESGAGASQLLSAKVKQNSAGKNQAPIKQLNLLTAFFNQGRLSDAEALALNISQQYPDCGLAYKVLGVIYLHQSLMVKARLSLQKAVALLPSDAEAHYNLANLYFDETHLERAASHYEKAIKLAPKFTQAHFNLAGVYKKQNKLLLAEASYCRALKLSPNDVEISLKLAALHSEQEKHEQAIVLLKHALVAEPKNAAIYYSLAMLLQKIKEYEEAIQYYLKAIEFDVANIDAYNQYALLLKQLGQLEEAETVFKKAIERDGSFAATFNNLGVLYIDSKRFLEADYCFKKSLILNPASAVSYNNYALLLLNMGKFDEAEGFCLKAIALQKDYDGAHNNLGLVLNNLNRFEEAAHHFEKVIEINPNHYTAMSNISLPLKKLGKLAIAESHLMNALKINSDFFDAHLNLGSIYQGQGKVNESIACTLAAIAVRPNSVIAYSNLFFDMSYSNQVPHQLVMARIAEYTTLLNTLTKFQYSEWRNQSKEKRLRIGFISGDFIEHPVTYFLRNMLMHIDFNQFELVAYTTDAREDDATVSLKKHFSQWNSLVSLSDLDAAQKIHADGIHILIDLSGHTAGNRLPLFAYKPAPVQATWLGYWATTGVAQMDYIIADEVSLPEQIKDQFTEKVQYIPSTRFCFTPPNLDLTVNELPALKNNFITLGCFQNYAKVNDDVLQLWAKLLEQIPHAKLRWQTNAFKDLEVVENLQVRLKKIGINTDQVLLLGSVSRNDYFKVHQEIDFILDCFPFTGMTTTCEALWMGVPTLTMSGKSLVERQGASLMTAVGLPEWVVDHQEAYLNKALYFANHLSELAALRMDLRNKFLASPVCDGKLFAENFAIALKSMWSSYLKPNENSLENQKIALMNQTLINDHKINSDEFNDKNTQVIVKILSATRMSEHEFWENSALGISFKQHQQLDSRLSADIAFENTRGLPEVFNQYIDDADDDEVLIFVHDDVWINEENFVDTVIAGLNQFDVIGVAGNKRRLPNQPAWAFIDTKFTWDSKEYLSGQVWHGEFPIGELSNFGSVPASCELMDGVFFAVKKQTLVKKNVYFDPQFDFHFYDLDFCRTARNAELSLGTWPICLTHQSAGGFGSQHWQEKYQAYLDKWEGQPLKSSDSQFNVDIAVSAELQTAIDDVLQIALTHQAAGNFSEAINLYQEVLHISACNAEAHYRIAQIDAKLHGNQTALHHFEAAVRFAPENERYWVAYISALLHIGSIDSALDALDLGQKYGLRAQTAQQIASEFMQLHDSNIANNALLKDTQDIKGSN